MTDLSKRGKTQNYVECGKLEMPSRDTSTGPEVGQLWARYKPRSHQHKSSTNNHEARQCQNTLLGKEQFRWK